MSKILDSAVDIRDLGQSNLWVIYGKSNTGKTHLGATFPKPMLYVQIGDDGSNTIAKVKGIKALRISNISDLKKLAEELLNDVSSEYSPRCFLDVSENKINRKNNCETRNILKSANAADEQTVAIKKLKAAGRLELLPDELIEVAALRLANPEASLSELSRISKNRLTRSGISHRLKRIMEIAEEVK